MVDVYISSEEKEQTLEELRRNIEEYVFVPIFKSEEELKRLLERGFIDFVVDAEYWVYSVAKRWGIVRPIKAWGRGEVGYIIRAMSIRKAIECVNAVVMEKKGKYTFIYFRIFTPDMPFPRRSYVDEDLASIKAQIRELSRPGNYIDEKYLDR